MLSLSLLHLLPLLLVTECLAAPAKGSTSGIPASALLLPSNQTQLVAPNDAPTFVTLGVGNQNYTCSPSGNYTSTGAVVQVLDITSFYPSIEFWQIQQEVFNDWSYFPSDDPYDPNLFQLLNEVYYMPILGQHYFIEKDKKLTPVWDFRANGATKGNSNAIIVAKEAGDIPSPSGYPNVDWVELTRASGGLADKVFRVYTVGGAPPESCKPGSKDITVKFTTQYYLYGGDIGN